MQHVPKRNQSEFPDRVESLYTKLRMNSNLLVVLIIGVAFVNIVCAKDFIPNPTKLCSPAEGPGECRYRCRLEGHEDGECVGKEGCVCYDEEIQVSCAAVAGPHGCQVHCSLNGHSTGNCVNGQCVCS